MREALASSSDSFTDDRYEWWLPSISSAVFSPDCSRRYTIYVFSALVAATDRAKPRRRSRSGERFSPLVVIVWRRTCCWAFF
ncbi:unnamed protein product [Linum tenue]|uniref:Uncharacterized protein n=1 Tax=Linum tenue TaxID=586396 RepID=A0AAV0IUG0_9ROSI|nr:unnamed protein product [Linum tenue]